MRQSSIYHNMKDEFLTIMEPGKGTDLGLTISEQTINRHGGEISVESQPGNGATFIIKLPISTVNNDGS